MATKTDDEVTELLRQILKVSALQVAINSGSLTQSARALKLAGLDNQTIADVLNTSAATIRTLTSNLRSKGKKRRA